uniref:Kinesin light chain n=1 Tax=Pseudo-nitzschia australis TaxID=44445 RepID=A0A7S4AKH7_9STRA|mmetsp:Transcript_26683/g.58489  ORF Transcript_26683/g.58489 Transcript_26683/m.58489 type:complete len:702 (+) Transcript_26683:311-2416(+)
MDVRWMPTPCRQYSRCINRNTNTNKKPDDLHHQQRRRQWCSRVTTGCQKTASSGTDRDQDPQACYVKSLGSGGFVPAESSNSNANISNGKNGIRDDLTREDHRYLREQRQLWGSTKKTKRTPISPSSFLTSTIRACTGVGKMGGGNFLEEQNEETRVEYRHCSPTTSGGRGGDTRSAYSACYGRQGDDDDDAAVAGVQLSKTTRVRTCDTVDSATQSVLILNPTDNIITEETISMSPPNIRRLNSSSWENKQNYTPKKSSAFSSARKLLFGSDDATDNLNDSNIISNNNSDTTNHPAAVCQCHCEGNDLSDFSSTYSYNNKNHVSPERNHAVSKNRKSNALECALNSGRSLMSSSFSPQPKALYAPAYDDGGNTCDGENQNQPIFESFMHDNVQYPSLPHNGFDHSNANIIINIDNKSNNNDMGGHSEIQYWRQRLHYASKHNGKKHLSTAEAYLNLGLAQLKLLGSSSSSSSNSDPSYLYLDGSMNLNSNHSNDADAKKRHQYDLAVENLTIAHGIFERKFGPNHLSVGRALDALALAIVRRANHEKTTNHDHNNNNFNSIASGNTYTVNEKDLKYAQRLLEEAFALRVHHLGVWHVDTVDTFNKLASVHLHLGEIREAAKAYQEVFLVRTAIFGEDHPSVAISAHSLANCHYRLGEVRLSLKWYQISLDIYETMGLKYRHPTVAKLLKDRSRLEKYMEV